MAAAAVSSPPPLPSSAPSNRRTSSGILHNVKRAVFGPNKSTIDDSEFKTTQDDFNTLNTLLNTLRTNIAQYNKATLNLTTSARATTQSFADVIKDAARPNPYSTTLLTSTQAHNELADKVETSGLYTRDTLQVIEQQIDVHKQLLARIEERNKLRTDFLYYQHKLEGLQKEREDRQLKGRVEKAADVEKMDRNSAKLSDSGDRYRVYNAELMHDLQMLYISRLKTYGPLLRQFVYAEKRFSSDYYLCMAGVDREDGSGSGGGGRVVADGLSINVSAASEQRAVIVPAEHSPMVDQPFGMSPSNPFEPFDITPSPIGGLTPTNVMRKNSGAFSASSSAASATQPHSRNTASDGHGALAPYISYPYDQHNGSAEAAIGHNGPAATAPILSPLYQQPFSFNQPQWTAATDQATAAAGGPRVDVFSDPFIGNAAVNPFDDLDEFAAVATPAQTTHNKPSFSSFPSVSTRPSLPSVAAVPEYHPAPYVPPPAPAPVAVAVVPVASVVMLDGSEIEDVVEDEGETDEDAEGADPGAAIEEEPEGIPSASVVAPAPAPAAVAPTPAPVAATPGPHLPPAVAPAVLAPPPQSSFAALHTAAAPRPPAVPGRLPTSLPPSPPASRPTPPSSRPVQWLATVTPPRSPQSAQSDNPFDDD